MPKERRKYTEAEIQEVSNISIIDYITANGIGELTRQSNNYYKLSFEGHDSIVIDTKKNYFVHNAIQGQKNAQGNIINFIQYINHNDINFAQAIEEGLKFIGNGYQPTDLKFERETFKYDYQLVDNHTRINNYLTKRRGLSERLVNYLINSNLIAQDKYGNLIFNWTEEGHPIQSKEQIVGATQVVTRPVEGNNKYVKAGSKEHWGFNVTFGEKVETVYVFESAIDLLSYIDLHPDKAKNSRFCSMEGVKERTLANFVSHTHEYFKLEKPIVYLCVDNDYRGHSFLDQHLDFQEGKGEFRYDIPDYYSLSKREFAEIINHSKEVKLPLEIGIGVYLFERSKIGKENVFVQYYHSSIKDGIQQIKQDFDEHKNVISKFVEATRYETREKKRISDFIDKASHRETNTIPKVSKDWNEKIKIERAPSTYQSQTITKTKSSTVNKEIIDLKRDTRALSEETINHLSEDKGIDKDIISLFAKKGWLRETNTKDIAYIWTQNGEIKGGELDNGNIIKSSDNKGQFMFTVGKPQNIYLFDKPTEALSFLNLHRDISNSVFICCHENNSSNVHETILSLVRAGTVHTINNTLTNSKLGETVKINLFNSLVHNNNYLKYGKSQIAYHESKPIQDTWNKDLVHLKSIKKLLNRQKVHENTKSKTKDYTRTF